MLPLTTKIDNEIVRLKYDKIRNDSLLYCFEVVAGPHVLQFIPRKFAIRYKPTKDSYAFLEAPSNAIDFQIRKEILIDTLKKEKQKWEGIYFDPPFQLC